MEFEKGCISQEKANGLFANLTIASSIGFTTRKGMEFVNPEEFLEIFKQAKIILRAMCQYHGELLVKRNGILLSRKEGNGILNSVRLGGTFKDNERPVYVVWDFVPIEGLAKGVYEVPYEERIRLLKEMLEFTTDITLIPYKWVYSYEEARQHYEEVRSVVEHGVRKEGTVIKKRSAIWTDGTSTEQIKLKGENDCELVVIGFKEGTGKFEGKVGSLTCTTECGELVVNVNLRSDAQRDSVDDSWIGKIVQVLYCELIQDKKGKYSLDLPRLSGEEPIRWDKDSADTLEYLKDKEVK
jgi:DNA ligase-1